MAGRLFTSESVTEGHPDKIADQISDTVLDSLMEHDDDQANLRRAVETLLTTGLVVVAGEVSTNAYAPVAELVRKTILEIGYDSSDKGFDGTQLRRPGRDRRRSRSTSPRASTTATRRASAPPTTRSTSRAPATRA